MGKKKSTYLFVYKLGQAGKCAKPWRVEGDGFMQEYRTLKEARKANPGVRRAHNCDDAGEQYNDVVAA